jgi:hypothetical protein
MAKPAYWIVVVKGRDPVTFTRRSLARAYRALLKAQGIDSYISAIGGQQ